MDPRLGALRPDTVARGRRSDIPNDRLLRWDEATGVVGVFRHPAGYAIGGRLDAQGRLITCEHGTRRVSRTEHDGSITTIADRFDGKRLNSPNDAVVHSDGSIWFTDPSYGIDSDSEGHQPESEIGTCNVYRVDGVSGECRLVADDFVRPNGLAFSRDESEFYIADTSTNHIRVFSVADGGLGASRVFASCSEGVFWAAAGDGVGVEPRVRRPEEEPTLRHGDDIALLAAADGKRGKGALAAAGHRVAPSRERHQPAGVELLRRLHER